MEDSLSMTGPAELSAEQLLLKLGRTFDRITSINSKYNNAHEFLKDIIDNCITTLELSKQISGIGDNQEAFEKWLLDLLRAIYKNEPKSISKAQIEELKMIVVHSEERKQIIPIELKQNEAGYYTGKESGYIIADKKIQRWWVNNGSCGIEGSHKFTKDFQALIVDHRKNLSQIVEIYNAVDTSLSPAEVVNLLMKKIANYQEKTLRENFSSFRKKHNLPEAELREANHKRHRVTHCYNCKGHLETGIFLECSKCKWLVCNCGACGCGFTRGESEYSGAEYDEDSGKEDYEKSDELGLLTKELSDENRLYAQSKNDGWFYDDDDRRKRNDY